MTDKEIIKALECCLNTPVDCDNCAYTKYPVKDCNKILIKDITDLINRQQENLKIQANNIHAFLKMKDIEIERLKAEAIKEFAEKLKAKSAICVASDNGQEIYSTKMYSIMAYTLDDLVVEMVGADNG